MLSVVIQFCFAECIGIESSRFMNEFPIYKPEEPEKPHSCRELIRAPDELGVRLHHLRTLLPNLNELHNFLMCMT